MSIKQLFRLPTLGQGCDDASFHTSELDVNLVYTYESDDGTEFQGYIRFRRFVAFRFSNEAHTTNFPKEAYDRVVCIDDSDWLLAAKNRVPDGNRWPFERKHFGVYLSNVGYYEIIAEECVVDEVVQIPT